MVDRVSQRIYRAKMALTQATIYRLLAAMGRQSDQTLIWLTHVLEHVARTPFHKRQMQQLRGLFENKHPALQLARRVFTELHPNFQRKLIANLGVNAVWLGEMKRREYTAREGVRPPFLIAISPTMHCNLRCIGCYAGAYPWENYLSY